MIQSKNETERAGNKNVAMVQTLCYVIWSATACNVFPMQSTAS